MGDLPFSLNPQEADALVTVKDIEYEIGTLINEHANEFPLENREAVLGTWIQQEGSMALGYIRYDKQPFDIEFTDEQQTILKVGVIYLVCYRCLKRIHMNRSPQLPWSALTRTAEYYRTEAYSMLDRLNFLLNGANEYAYETPDHMPLPVADAGANQTVSVGDTVTFDGSGSVDHRGIYEYYWDFIYEGASETMTGVAPTFTFDAAGTYEVRMYVVDYDGYESEYDRVTITVE